MQSSSVASGCYRVASAIPGRVRLQLACKGRGDGLMRLAENHLAAVSGVTTVEADLPSRSLVVRFPRELDLLDALIGALEERTGTTALLPSLPSGAIGISNGVHGSETRSNGGGSNGGGKNGAARQTVLRVVHAFPGRLRVSISPRLRKAFSRAREAFAGEPGIHSVETEHQSAHLIVRYDASVHHPRSVLERVDAVLTHIVQTPPAPDAVKRASDIATEAPSGLNPLVLPTVAIVAAASGALPIAAMGTTLAVAAIPLIGAAIEGIRSRRFNVAQLDVSAILVLSSLGDFLTGSIMTWLIGLGDLIRDRTMRRSRRAVSELMSAASQVAWVQRGESVVSVPVTALEAGEVVLVFPGDQVPVDGVVVDGHALVDQKLLTGESVPVPKEPGDAVFALTIVADGRISVRVEHIGAETRAGQIVEMIENAPLADTRISNYAARIGDRLVGPIFAVAGLTFLVTADPLRAASILILDFVTGIRVSAPTTILSAMTAAAKQGLFIKGGKAMEKLAEVDAIVFDKTGTLTRGEPRVTSVDSFDPALTPNDVLSLAAAAEAQLKHPAARAIVDAARERGLEPPPLDSMEYAMGLGVCAQVAGRRLHVGSQRYMRELGVDQKPAAEAAARQYASGNSVVYVAGEGVLLGLLTYSDPPRPEAGQVVQALLDRGVRRIVMLTGDNERAAKAVASHVAITDVVADAFPEKKADVVQQLRDEGYTVAVIGDGIDDSPAFTRADVGISLQHGADVARETADVILLDGDLRGLPRSIDLARQAMGLLRQNVNIIVGPTAVGIAAAVIGVSNPLISTLINNGTTVITGLNALRPLLQKALPPPAKPNEL